MKLAGELPDFRVMAGAASEPTLAEIAAQAGAGSEITQYLEQRGVRSLGALALVASDVDQLDNVLVAPLLAGWRPNPAEPGIQLSDFMWALATETRKRVAASAVIVPTAPSASAATAPTAGDSKTPKTLPAGEWRNLMDRYNSITFNGEPREFPEEELLGAESVVARVLHEHRITKSYHRVGGSASAPIVSSQWLGESAGQAESFDQAVS